MKRIYYMTRSLPSVLGISRDLHEAGVGQGRIHVTGKNVAALQVAQVNTTTLFEDTDIMHSGFVGAMYGMLAGVAVGFLLAGMDPWGSDLGSEAVIGATLFFSCFGAWLGGIHGISSRNHHIAPYMSDLERDESRYLVMVDADDERQAQRIEKVMHERHTEAREAGHEDHYSPFF
jgi:hypothetical protein